MIIYILYTWGLFFFWKLLTIENNYFEMNVHWNKSAVLLLLIYLYHRPVTRAFALRNDNSLSNEKYGREFPPIVYVSCFSCIL